MNTTRLRLVLGLTTALSFNAAAGLIDFNNLPLGSVADGVYGNVQIYTSTYIEDAGGQIRFPGHGTIATGGTGVLQGPDFTSPAIFVSAQTPPPDYDGRRWYVTQIGANFLTPMSSFSVDVSSGTFTSSLIYTGVDSSGAAWSGSAQILPYRPFEGVGGYRHFDISAPAGGYLTGFFFEQGDSGAIEVDISMDNLSYTQRVPEVTGWSIIAMSALGLVVLKRRLR